MDKWILIWIYSVAVVASSLIGGWLPRLFRLTHVRMQVALSFVGGVMLGIGLLHMLPHSYVQTENLDLSLGWMLIGLIGMFLLIRTFHFHEHGPATPDSVCAHHQDHDHLAYQRHEETAETIGEPIAAGGAKQEPAATAARPEPLPSAAATAERRNRSGAHHGQSRISWIGVAFGLSLHAFLDGVALGAAVISEGGHGPLPAWAGLGVFLAVVLHKPLDALSITTLMQARGWSHRWQQIVNAGFAMTCPLGAWAFLTGVDQYAGSQLQPTLIGTALALSAGIFLCISLSDLLPEVQFHRHDRLKLSAALIIGVLCAYAIRYLEPAHSHPSRESAGSPATMSPIEPGNVGVPKQRHSSPAAWANHSFHLVEKRQSSNLGKRSATLTAE